MVSNRLMNKINDDSVLQSFLQLKLNLFLKKMFLPESEASTVPKVSTAISVLCRLIYNLVKCREYINSPFRKIWLWKPGQMQGIYSPQTESQQLHWHRQPRGQWRIQQFPATGWLTLVLKKKQEYLFTKWCVENSVLSKLLLKTHLSIEWSICFIYLEWGQEASKDVYKS